MQNMWSLPPLLYSTAEVTRGPECLPFLSRAVCCTHSESFPGNAGFLHLLSWFSIPRPQLSTCNGRRDAWYLSLSLFSCGPWGLFPAGWADSDREWKGTGNTQATTEGIWNPSGCHRPSICCAWTSQTPKPQACPFKPQGSASTSHSWAGVRVVP